MKKNILMSLTLIIVFTAITFAQNRVTLFKDCDYRGDRHPLYEGEYHDYELGIGNDNLSSMQIPYGFSVTVYTDNGFKGRSETFTSNVKCLPADLNDKVSSIRVTRVHDSYNKKSYSYNENNYHPDMVTVYKDSNFRGASQFLSAGYHNANGLGVGNDQISSIQIPRGWKVTVYTDSDYRGRSATFTSNVTDLKSQGLNDQISSILITKLESHSYNNNNNYRNKGRK